MINLFFIAGTKGGVGKSTFASLLADVSVEQNFKPYLFDCDNENHSLYKSFSNIDEILVKQVNPDSDSHFPLDEVVNEVVSICDEHRETDTDISFIVDMKAGTTDFVHKWFDTVPFKDLKKVFGIKIWIVGCLTSDPDSVFTFNPWLAYFKGKRNFVDFIIVKNKKEGTDFSYYDEEMKSMAMKLNTQELDLIKVEGSYLLEIKNEKTSLGQVVNGHKELESCSSFMDKRRLKSYYLEITETLSGLFNNPTKEESA